MEQEASPSSEQTRVPSRRLIVGFACAHFFISVLLFLTVIGAGMASFDEDDPGPPSMTVRLANAALMVWSLPLVTPALKLGIHLPIAVQWLTLFGNSLLWGWGAWYLLGRARRRRQAAAVPNAQPSQGAGDNR